MSKSFATQSRLLQDILAGEAANWAEQEMELATTAEAPLPAAPESMSPRKVVVRSKLLSGSAGSSSVQMGSTHVVASVNGPREQQSGDSAILEGVLNVSLRGGDIDPSFRYSVEHALRAVVCLRKLARTEIDIELNVLTDDGGSLAACLLAAGIALASANIEMFDILVACNVLLIPTTAIDTGDSDQSTLQIVVDPDRAMIAEHASGATALTMGAMPSIGQIVCVELGGGCTLRQRQLRRALPAVFEHCLALYATVRRALLKNVAEEAL